MSLLEFRDDIRNIVDQLGISLFSSNYTILDNNMTIVKWDKINQYKDFFGLARRNNISIVSEYIHHITKDDEYDIRDDCLQEIKENDGIDLVSYFYVKDGVVYILEERIIQFTRDDVIVNVNDKFNMNDIDDTPQQLINIIERYVNHNKKIESIKLVIQLHEIFISEEFMDITKRISKNDIDESNEYSLKRYLDYLGWVCYLYKNGILELDHIKTIYGMILRNVRDNNILEKDFIVKDINTNTKLYIHLKEMFEIID